MKLQIVRILSLSIRSPPSPTSLVTKRILPTLAERVVSGVVAVNTSAAWAVDRSLGAAAGLVGPAEHANCCLPSSCDIVALIST